MFDMVFWQFTRKSGFPGRGIIVQQRGNIRTSMKTEATAELANEKHGGARGFNEESCRTWLLAGSTRRSNSARKSASRICPPQLTGTKTENCGNETAKEGFWNPALSGLPSAIRKPGPVGAADD